MLLTADMRLNLRGSYENRGLIFIAVVNAVNRVLTSGLYPVPSSIAIASISCLHRLLQIPTFRIENFCGKCDIIMLTKM